MTSAPSYKWAKRVGFATVSSRTAGLGRLTRIYKDACRMAGTVQETCSEVSVLIVWEVTSWSFKSSGLLKWLYNTSQAWLRMTWHHLFLFVAGAIHFGIWDKQNAKRMWHEAVRSAPNFSFLREVSHKCFVIDIVNWCQLQVRRLASFLMLLISNFRGSLEFLRSPSISVVLGLWTCVPRTSHRTASCQIAI